MIQFKEISFSFKTRLGFTFSEVSLHSFVIHEQLTLENHGEQGKAVINHYNDVFSMVF